MRTIIIFYIVLLLFTNCSEGTKKDSTVIPATGEESAAAEEEKATLSNTSLIDLSKEKNIQKLLCQGWVMDDDIEVMESNGNAQGIYPVRCFYLFDDLSYTRNVRNFMEYGKWAYNDEDKTLALKGSDGSKDEYKIH